MSDAGHVVARIADLERRSGGWVPLRSHFGITAFGVNGWVSDEDGGTIVSEHDEQETGHQELYAVLDGEVTFSIGGETFAGGPGTLVFVAEPVVRRGATGRATVLALGAKAGEPFRVSAWEQMPDVIPLFTQGEYAKARELLVAYLVEHPDDATAVYNLACADAQLGNADSALSSLQRSVELDERFAGYAQIDDDLESLRDLPGFPLAPPEQQQDEAKAIEGGWARAHIDDLEALPVLDGALTWRPVRRRFDIQAFGVNAYTADEVGRTVVEEHSDENEELYVVVTGRATFSLGEDEVDAPAGTAVFPRPGTRRDAVAAEPGTTVLAVGAKPGEAYTPSAWEPIFAAYGYLDLGEIERGRAELEQAMAARPDAWQGPFHAACFEARVGNSRVALAHARRAAELGGDEARERLASDSDLDSIRDDPGFPTG